MVDLSAAYLADLKVAWMVRHLVVQMADYLDEPLAVVMVESWVSTWVAWKG